MCLSLHNGCCDLNPFALNNNTLIIISPNRQLHTTTNLILLSLAVSDLLVGLAVMPLAIILQQSCGIVGKTTCTISLLLGFTLTSASVGTMVLISVDRYVAICDPLHYSSMITRSRVKICVSLCWLFSVCYSFIILKDNLSQIYLSKSCYQDCTVIINHISGAVDLILTFFSPVTVIIVLYMRVFVVAVSQARIMRSQVSAVESKIVTVRKSEMRAARTLGITLLVFILCLCPYFCPSLVGQDTPAGADSSPQLWLFYCNSSFNPLIYALFYPWFRKAVKITVSLQILRPGSHWVSIM